MVASNASGILVSGLYGSGKSTAVEELASTLEGAGVPYAALDLDWLWWLGVPGLDRSQALGVLYDNLASVARSYLAAGATHFAMAWSVREAEDLVGVRKALPFPVKVVELTVPVSVIEARLGGSVTSGRLADLAEARRWHRAGLGRGFGDIELDGDRPVRDIARDILNWAGWERSR